MNQSIMYVLQRLKEPSTWNGLAAVLIVAGVNFSPEAQEAMGDIFSTTIEMIGVVYAAVNIFWKKDSQAQPNEPDME